MRIERLELWTPDTDTLRDFYGGTLGLPVTPDTNDGADAVAFAVGGSRLTFRAAPPGWGGGGCYHFAFNVPEDRFADGVAWLRARADLLRDPEGNETFHFASWNAHAVYFADPAGNIAELIARHDLSETTGAGGGGPFAARHLLSVSEIGLPTPDVPGLGARLCVALGIAPYRGGGDSFLPVGDERGLLILTQTGRPWYPDGRSPARAFPVAATVCTDRGTFQISGPPYRAA